MLKTVPNTAGGIETLAIIVAVIISSNKFQKVWLLGGKAHN